MVNTTPKSDVQEALENAFIDGPTSLTIYELDDKEKAQMQGFALQSTAYYDLELYLKVAATLPSTKQRFEELYPKEKMAKLIELDANIYDELSKCLVDVNQHCSDFSLKTFGNFHAISQNIIVFCETFAKKVQGKGLLADQIEILADESIPEGDKKLVNAVKITKAILNQLSEDSRKREEDCEKLLGELEQFRLITVADKENVDKIHEKLVGPRKEGKSYFEVLSETLAKMKIELDKKLNELQQKERQKNPFSGAPTYLWIGGIGLIITAISIITSLTIDIDKYKQEVERQEAANKVLLDNINAVGNLCNAVKNVDATIGNAITSLQSFKKTFGRLRADFQLIKERVGDISEDTRADDPVLRGMARSNLEDACKKWHEVRGLAEAFVSFKPPVVETVEGAKALVAQTKVEGQ